MDKKTQGKIALERTIAGSDFNGLKTKRDASKVFSNFAIAPQSPRAEDVFQSKHEPQALQRAKPVVITKRPKGVFIKPRGMKSNEP